MLGRGSRVGRGNRSGDALRKIAKQSAWVCRQSRASFVKGVVELPNFNFISAVNLSRNSKLLPTHAI